jgi:hypothetical protein
MAKLPVFFTSLTVSGPVRNEELKARENEAYKCVLIYRAKLLIKQLVGCLGTLANSLPISDNDPCLL